MEAIRKHVLDESAQELDRVEGGSLSVLGGEGDMVDGDLDQP